MDSWFKTLSTINLVGAIHALVQALLLVFIKRGNRRANRIMALFLLVLAIGMANGFIAVRFDPDYKILRWIEEFKM